MNKEIKTILTLSIILAFLIGLNLGSVLQNVYSQLDEHDITIIGATDTKTGKIIEREVEKM